MTRDQLKNIVEGTIKTNGNQQITGENLQETLKTILDNVPSSDEVVSGISGIAQPNDTIPATGFFQKIADTAQTYTNYKDSGNAAIVVTAADLDVVNGVANNRVILRVNNGVAKKIVERVKGDAGDTIDLTPFLIKADAQYKTFELVGAEVAVSGSIITSTAFLAAKNIPVSAGEEITIEGYSTAVSSRRGAFYNSTTQSSGTLLSVIPVNGSPTHVITVPAGAVSMALNVAVGTNTGADPANSPYKDSLKIYTGTQKEDILKAERIKGTINTPQLAALEEAAFKNSFFDGTGAPAASLGNNSDKYLDKSSLRIYIKSNGSWSTSYFLGGENPFSYPSAFSFQPYPLKRQTNGVYVFDGLTNIRDAFVQSYIDSLTPYYVDAINGNDSNSGLTQATAFKRLYTAIVTKGARLIYFIGNPGFVDMDQGLKGLTDISSSSPLIIIGVGNVILSGAKKANLYTWTANGACWQTARSTVQNVMDFDNLDANGHPTELTQVASVAECQSTLNSYYTDGTTVYVRPQNNAMPTSKIELLLTDSNSYTPTANVPFVYFENIGFVTSVSMGSLRVTNNATTQFNTKVYLYKCYGFKNKYGNIFSFDNMKEVWLQDCKSYKPKQDGFNYHTTKLGSGYTATKAVEINTYAIDMGKDFPAETSSNGSTMHEGGTIIRMNCTYEKGRGGNVADVNNGIKSLNLNVKATGNYRTDGGSFLVEGTGSEMWLYDCIGLQDLSTQFSISATTGAAYYKDLTKNQQFVGTVTAL